MVMDDVKKMKMDHAQASALSPEIDQVAEAASRLQGVALPPEIAQVAEAVSQFRVVLQTIALSPEIAQAANAVSQFRRALQAFESRPDVVQATTQIQRVLQAVALPPEFVQSMAQYQERARAFDLEFGRIQTATESIDSLTSPNLPETLDSALRLPHAAPFRSADPYPVIHIPKTTPRKTALNPVARLRDLGNPIAADYCKEAIELLELGYYKSSAHLSICAVESVVREFNPKEDFGKVIDQMRADGAIHPAYAETVKKLWGYSSDRPGIRHADYPSSPFRAVSAKDARMLYGVCAFIAEYLADTQD